MFSYEFNDIEHFREQLRGWDTPAVQVEPGRLSIRLNSVDLGGVILSDIRVNRKVIDHSRIETDWLSFIIGLSPSTFCGMEVDQGHMTILAPGREYRSVLASEWHSIEILIPSAVMAAEGLRVTPRLLLGPETAVVRLPVELVGIFQRLVQAAFRTPGSSPIDDAWLRRSLLRALDGALKVGAYQLPTHNDRRRTEGYELTLRVIRHVENRHGQRIAVGEVAAELGVTARALHYAVRSVLGISPLELILAYRLNHVRNELWDTRLSGPSITTAAMTQDFGHLGRFSQHYNALFGELPSETLKRIQQLGG